MNMLTVYWLVGGVLMCVVQNQRDLKYFTQTSELQSNLWHVMEYLCDCVQHL